MAKTGFLSLPPYTLEPTWELPAVPSEVLLAVRVFNVQPHDVHGDVKLVKLGVNRGHVLLRDPIPIIRRTALYGHGVYIVYFNHNTPSPSLRFLFSCRKYDGDFSYL